MGGKSAQTIGYRYRHLLFEIWAQHADVLHRFVAGGKQAWTGCVHENQTIQIDAPAIWGDDEDNGEGGMVGQMDVQFGLSTQPVNARMTTILGPRQTGNRGWFSTVFEGIFGSYVPNPKTRAVLLERIHAGWPGGVAWYPAKAPIPLAGASGMGATIAAGFATTEWRFDCQPTWEVDGYCQVPSLSTDTFTLDGSADDLYTVDLLITGSVESKDYTGGTPIGAHFQSGGTAGPLLPDHNTYRLEISNPPAVYHLNRTEEITSERLTLTNEPLTVQMAGDAVVTLYAASNDGYQDPPSQWLSAEVAAVDGGAGGTCAINAMNPAHIIRYMLTQKKQIPDAMLAEANWMASADTLFAEGFGLCEEFDPDQETPEAFILRICDIIGACCTQSKTDGLIYLDLLRNDYIKANLPELTDDDIVDWQDEQAVPAELTNSVQIGWRDVLIDGGLERITPPIKALGHIRTHGREMNQVIDMRGIPFEGIALRVAKRELDARSKPLVRLSITTLRRFPGLRPGQPLLINCPKRGRVDMVVRVGEVDHGTPTDARMRWVLLQDVFDLPATVEIDPTTVHDGDTPPVSGAGEIALEAPYVELVATLTTEQMAALGEEAGYLLTGVTAPTRGTNYGIYSKLASEAYERRGFADFSPTALTFAAALPLDGSVQLVGGNLLDRVAVGSWALWDDEIIRVDGVTGLGLLTMGRGCADTVPAAHAAGTRIFFLGDWNGTDQREYASGDELAVKLPVRTGPDEQPLADKTQLDVTFAQRQFRPYPPGNLMINGQPFYASGAVVVSPPGGGGGGAGGGGGPVTPPAITTSGTPASTTLGPNGGYPDNAPFPVPQPTVFGANVVDGGGFGVPGDLANWRDQSGNPLDSRWSLVGGRLCFFGTGQAAAFYWPARRTLAQQILPHYDFGVDGTIECEPGGKGSIGVGRGFSTAGNSMSASTDLDAYGERPMSVLAEYGAPTAVAHAFADKRDGLSVTASGQVVVTIVAPAVLALVEGAAPRRVYFDDVAMEITENAPATTPQTIANLDFSAGLTGWVQFPPASALSPSPIVSAGECTFTPVSEYGTHKYLINEDPIVDMDTIDKWLDLMGETWCNDPTVFSGMTQSGVGLQYAVKLAGDYNYTAWAKPLERGDWTARRRWLRQTFMTGGLTFHAAVQFQCALGYSCGVRNLSGAVTTGPIA